MNWCYTANSFALLGQTIYRPKNGWTSIYRLELAGRTDVESIASVILNESLRKNIGWEETTKSLLTYLSWILVRRIKRGALKQLSDSESPTITLDPGAWRTVRAALEYCDNNFRRPFSLENVAQSVGYSPNHLSRIFSRYIGRSLFQYVRDLRIAEAKRLLESTAMPVSEISYALGCRDPSQFSHFFRKETGISPKAYRAELGIE